MKGEVQYPHGLTQSEFESSEMMRIRQEESARRGQLKGVVQQHIYALLRGFIEQPDWKEAPEEVPEILEEYLIVHFDASSLELPPGDVQRIQVMTPIRVFVDSGLNRSIVETEGGFVQDTLGFLVEWTSTNLPRVLVRNGITSE